MSGAIGTAPPPLQTILPSYAYLQYSADEDIVAWHTAYTGLAQSYLDWFNATPLGVYAPFSEQLAQVYATAIQPLYTQTGQAVVVSVQESGVTGPLLDWTATGIYGIARPVLSSLKTQYLGGLGAFSLGTVALGGDQYLQSGTATVASDDIYKRVLTWWLYRGDGKLFSSTWLRRRVARFIYGANGEDVGFDQFSSVSLVSQPLAPPASFRMASVAGGTLAATTYYVRVTYVTPDGETLASAEQSIAVAADHLLQVLSVTQVNGAFGWNVYVSTSTGTETKQNSTPIAFGATFTEPTTGLIAGAALPTSNTSVSAGSFIITAPTSQAAQYFTQCLANGVLTLPFQYNFSVVLT